jgi:hypothetical protein
LTALSVGIAIGGSISAGSASQSLFEASQRT